jgi:pilus assembly protein Flp/PilA
MLEQNHRARWQFNPKRSQRSLLRKLAIVVSASAHRERSDLSKIKGVVAAQYPENLCFSPSNNLRFSTVEVLTGLKTGSSGKSKRGNNHMKAMLSTFLRDESGATAIEYGLIAVGIAIAIIATVNGIGSGLSSTFSSVSTSLK